MNTTQPAQLEHQPRGGSRGRRRHWGQVTDLTYGTAVLLLLLGFVGCKREERAFRANPPAEELHDGLRLTVLQPGQPSPTPHAKNDYEGNAYALSEGQTLYSQFNCVGCHAHGGGGMGPPLMDAKWRYGSEPEQIFATIMEGRPNGMPSFRGKLSAQQAWKLVGFVRSLSGLVPKDAAPSREDHMKNSPSPSSMKPEKPVHEKEP